MDNHMTMMKQMMGSGRGVVMHGHHFHGQKE
jgi:hypothetical protein